MTDFEIHPVECPIATRGLPRMEFRPVSEKGRGFVERHGKIENPRWMSGRFQCQAIQLVRMGYELLMPEVGA